MKVGQIISYVFKVFNWPSYAFFVFYQILEATPFGSIQDEGKMVPQTLFFLHTHSHPFKLCIFFKETTFRKTGLRILVPYKTSWITHLLSVIYCTINYTEEHFFPGYYSPLETTSLFSYFQVSDSQSPGTTMVLTLNLSSTGFLKIF